MKQVVRPLVLAVVGAFLLAGCRLSLPGPIELDEGVFGLDGLPVVLTADMSTSSIVVTSTDFSGTFSEPFTVDPAGIPSALRNLFTIASVTEDVGLDITLVATSESELPEAFTVGSASLTNVIVKKGATTLFAGDFSTVPGGSMTFTKGLCAGEACTYTASASSALVEIELSGSTANKLAKAIVAGGDFTVSGAFAVVVDPGLPSDTELAVVLVSLGAVLE